MKSLLLKDFLLIKAQGKSILLIIAVGFIMSTSGGGGIFYLGLVLSLLSLGSMSYDEFDHGYAFLFTLPFTRKQYVVEKYIFGMMFSFAGIIAGVLAAAAAGLFGKDVMPPSEIIFVAAEAIIMSSMILGVMIPVRLRFDSEQGRIVSGIIIGVFFAGAILLVNALPESVLSGIDLFINNNGAALMLIAALGIVAIIVLISLFVSARIINKKEF